MRNILDKIDIPNKILDNLKFKYENTSKPRNPYGRYGKSNKKSTTNSTLISDY